MSRQIPGLPCATAGTKRRAKKNKTGILGRILDPIAQREAQHTAKAIQMATAQASTLAPLSPEASHTSTELSDHH